MLSLKFSKYFCCFCFFLFATTSTHAQVTNTLEDKTNPSSKEHNTTSNNKNVTIDPKLSSQAERDAAYNNPKLGLRMLKEGNQRFISDTSIHPHQDHFTVTHSNSGQKPFAVVIGCSDSRVPSEIIFDQGVGDLFIVRVAGQVMAGVSYGSIEYAVQFLGAKLIVVLGHSSCGAVHAAVDIAHVPPGHIINLIDSIKPAVEASRKLKGDILQNSIEQNVLNQVAELKRLEPIISNKVKSGELLVVGAVYNLSTGKVEFIK